MFVRSVFIITFNTLWKINSDCGKKGRIVLNPITNEKSSRYVYCLANSDNGIEFPICHVLKTFTKIYLSEAVATP